jgi:hypothetical protein
MVAGVIQTVLEDALRRRGRRKSCVQRTATVAFGLPANTHPRRRTYVSVFYSLCRCCALGWTMAENIYSKGTRVWFVDKDQAWISAEVSQVAKGANDAVTLTFVDERGKVRATY